ncbi:MAG: type II secretion system F family protein [Candidatus Methanoperedens sp.]
MNLIKFDAIAYKLFGENIASKNADLSDLQQKMTYARIGVPALMYLARAYLISLLAALPVGGAIFLLFRTKFEAIFGVAALAAVPILAVFSGFLIYNFVVEYPGIVANIRGKKIEMSLPHAVALMHALSRGNGNIISFFEIIGRNKKLYSELSEEANGILIDITMFNIDVPNALKNAGKRTPSESFRNFVESLSTVITSGGDLRSFFLVKSEQYRLKAINENKSFMEMLGLLSEVYVTGFAAGPLFIITLLVVMGVIGGENFFILNIVVYLIVPGGALLFIVLLSSLTQGQDSEFVEPDVSDSHEENEVLQKASLRFTVYQFIKNPLLGLIEKPDIVLNITVPVALLFFVVTTYSFYGLEFNKMIYEIDDYLIFSTLIAVIPYSIFLEIQSSRLKKMVQNFPEFLNRLLSLHESGFTLTKSLKQLQLSELGSLNSEVQKMNADVEWHGRVVQALKNFGDRIKTIGVMRTASLLESAGKMTGNIKDSLSIAATDALTSRTLEEERRTTMKMQVIIIYFSFFIFLYVVNSLVSEFLPQLPDLPPESGGQAASIVGEGLSFTGIDKPLYVRLFFHAAVLEAFFSGLVAGQIGEGDAKLGLKHSIIMTIIAYVLFWSIS